MSAAARGERPWPAGPRRSRGCERAFDEDLVAVWLHPLQPGVLSGRTLILRRPAITAWVPERFSRVLDTALQEELAALGHQLSRP